MHGHEHAEEFDWDALGSLLEREREIELSFLTAAAGWLVGLPGAGTDRGGGAAVTRILDVGSGPGVTSCALARSFPDAEVVAVDGSAELLERAASRAAREGVADRVTTRRADFPGELDTLGEADLVWVSNVVHHVGDQQAMLDQLARSLRPGGVLAVVEGGLALRFLPRDIGMGRPGLQTRLDVAKDDWFAEMRAELPGSTASVEDWPAMLARSGLLPAATRSFLVDLPAPVDADVREHLAVTLARLRDRLGDRLEDADVEVLDQLLDERAATGLRRRSDVFYLSASTVHVARAR